ncbi:MAG: hypothetical protein AB1489_31410 [Acidobacteriota bacterium]
MKPGFGMDRKVLADTFRATREMLGLPQPAYARLFEVERALVQELEDGRLPAALDQRLLKFVLMVISLQRQQEFIGAFLREVQGYYGLEYIFEQRSPFLALFQQIVGEEMARFPWIADSVRFHCKAVRRRRLGSVLLLWAEQPAPHRAAVNVIPAQTPAFINFIKGHTVLLMPALYLFLDLNTSISNNPIVRDLESRLERREPIGLAVPRQLLTAAQINSLDDLAFSQMRLFAYSQDLGMVREAEYRPQNEK